MVEVAACTNRWSQTIEVRHQSQVGAARRAAKAAAQTLGFEPKACEEVALAITELATNLLKHAHTGKLVVTPLAIRGRVGLEIESQDQGPGMADVERALADGFSTAGSRGTGLGAVNRLMDELDIVSQPGRGTRILCRKWRRVPSISRRTCPLAFGVATRPHPGDEQNGDAFVLRQWGESALVGIIDGLGHGPFAHQAAETARHYIESHYDIPLAQLFLGAGRACRATRGVVMALARFDWAQEKLAYASVGDIEVRIFPRSGRFPFPTQRGILGLNAPAAVVTEHPWTPTNLMVLHSDGLRSHWAWEDFPGLTEQPASEMAHRLLRALARDQDDATVLVVQKSKA
ncbi:MAG TPA: ATP-binding SpoIIE family protein phosphatase [Candidatus Sulfotelmatobacter sp.]|nr:ATP-binding SpoIIE family protein phosphatase [Candidatus Sulfotelmatobacter sp.]